MTQPQSRWSQGTLGHLVSLCVPTGQPGRVPGLWEGAEFQAHLSRCPAGVVTTQLRGLALPSRGFWGCSWRELGAPAGRWLRWEHCCRRSFPWRGVERGAEGPGGSLGTCECPCAPGNELRAGNVKWYRGRSTDPMPGVSVPSRGATRACSGYSCRWRGCGAGAGRGELLPRLQGPRRGSNSPHILGSS